MIRVTNVQTVFDMVEKGAVLVIKRGSEKKREVMLASLVVPKTDRMVEVESAVAYRATEGGKMRRLTEKEWQLAFFRDFNYEYWRMVQ